MTQTTILETVKKLVALQKIDREIFHFKRELKAGPEVLVEAQKQFEAKKARLKELEEKFKAIQLERKGLEGDLLVKEDAICKVNAQLSEIKTNKEYTAKLVEIEGVKADKSIIEEKILNFYDLGDQVQISINQEKEALKQEEQKYLKEKQVIEASMKDLEGKKSVLENQRKQVAPELDKNLLLKYEKILNNKDGLALVPVTGASCGGCYMNVPAQVVNQIKMHQDMVQCEFCARILYLQEDV